MSQRNDPQRKRVSFDASLLSPALPDINIHVDDKHSIPLADPTLGCSFVQINATPLPIKHRPISIYPSITESVTTATSFHKIFLTTKLNATAKFFYKENKVNSPYMPELEAFCWGCYHFLIPDLVPQSTRAIYHTTKNNDYQLSNIVYTGISSKSIPHFKSTKDEPLREDDLNIFCLHQGVSIETLNDIDHRITFDAEFLARSDKDILTEVSVNNLFIPITVGDIKRFRKMKGLGGGLTASILLKEDDLHRGNMSAYGERVDFDKSLWNILCLFQSSGYVDSLIRNRCDGRFVMTENDIRHFPNLTDATPYYWPTRPMNLTNKIASLASTNPWPENESEVYKKLEFHPVFKYFEFQTILKFILANPYEHIAALHVRAEIQYNNQYIIDMLKKDLSDRIDCVLKIVTQMPEFKAFIKDHGDYALKQVITELEENNQYLSRKIKKIENTIETMDKKNPAGPASLQEILKLIAKKEAYQRQMIDIKLVEQRYQQLQPVEDMIANLQQSFLATASPHSESIFTDSPSTVSSLCK